VLDSSDFRALVSGQRRGVWPSCFRFLAAVAAAPYGWVVRWRNWRYDAKRANIRRVSAVVVSVGNLTLGGTGKTPMIEWLARWFARHDVRVGLVSRGYGAKAGRRNDEALELEQKLPGVPHLQNPDRVAAAENAIREFDCQLILLDDAFQHRRIARDLDIVLLDGLEPFGWGKLFPRGTLREPLTGLARADVVVLSRADLLSAAERESIRHEVARRAPQAVWVEAVHRPRYLLNSSGEQKELSYLDDRRVAVFCGIGNPAGFQQTLARIGVQPAAFREFPDHHAYTQHDLESLENWARRQNAQAVLCTHKDLVKIGQTQFHNTPLWAVVVGLDIIANEESMSGRLNSVLEKITAGES